MNTAFTGSDQPGRQPDQPGKAGDGEVWRFSPGAETFAGRIGVGRGFC